MENNENTKQDCGCNSNSSDNSCCQPPKSKCWMKILFALVILAVVVIVTIKLTQKFSAPPAINNDTTSVTQQSGCDTSKCKSINTIYSPEKNSCCPQSKN